AILLASLAWLAATPINEIYLSVAWIKGIRPWALAICRNLQLTRTEFVMSARSLRVRGMNLSALPKIIISGDWTQLRRNVSIIGAVLRTILSRQFSRIAKATLAWERHHVSSARSGDRQSSVSIDHVFV